MQIQISNSCKSWYNSDGSFEQDQQQIYNFQSDAQIFYQELQNVKLDNISSIFVNSEGVQVSFINCNSKSYKCSQFSELITILERANISASKEAAKVAQYENIAKYLQGVVSGYSVYATSYGVGVYALSSKTEANIKDVEKILDNLGIKYTNEYSDARWVYRFRISKAKKNLDILKSI